MQPYLEHSDHIDWKHPLVSVKARELSTGAAGDEAIARRCFEFVRDDIRHSWDFRMNPVTCRASDVLLHGTGFCYAKSHLLAALLRANAIPAGLCYQRLSVGTQGPPFSLHGLNAVHLQRYGWFRIDARGNKPGVAARFDPPTEALAFSIAPPEERDFHQIWSEPHPAVIDVLMNSATIEVASDHLPDMEEMPTTDPSGRRLPVVHASVLRGY
jgi:transglutaminase-like putative cysteine protease